MQGRPPRFTRHARNRMRWYKVSGDEVAKCLEEPQWTTPGAKDTTHAWRARGEQFLRVTFVEERGIIWVITAVIKERPPGR